MINQHVRDSPEMGIITQIPLAIMLCLQVAQPHIRGYQAEIAN
jgi:hypothetical protein